jgi:transposase
LLVTGFTAGLGRADGRAAHRDPRRRFTNNEAERTIRPVKVAQRTSGGCWRTLDGLANFAVIQSYLSTAGKWGIPKIDVLRGLFSGNPGMPAGVEPALTG